MLHPEKAREQLEKFEDSSAVKKAIAALLKLPGALASAGLAFLGRRPDGKPFTDWSKRYKAQREAAHFLDARSSRDRERVFTALFPKLGSQIEAGWQVMMRMPYQMGYERKAFRAPQDPEVTSSRRDSWLTTLVSLLQEYDREVLEPAWLAAWAPHIAGYHGGDEIGYLLAGTIDAGGPRGDEVFQILKDSASGQHDIGSMGRHVSRALMACSRPEAWEFMEKMLLAAQRQEGLRQVILESIDECHPQAFSRMVRLILDHNLVRFSSVVRAVDVWFALNWDSVTPGVITKTLEKVHSYLGDESARQETLKKGPGEDVFLALWCLAHTDARLAIEAARPLVTDRGLERRFATVELLSRLQHPLAAPLLRQAVEDEDLRIALKAFQALPESLDSDDAEVYAAVAEPPDRQFAMAEKLLARIPEKAPKLKPLVWPWAEVPINGQDVADRLLATLGKQPLKKLFPYLSRMSGYGRFQVASRIGKQKNWDSQARQLMFDLVSDRDSSIRQVALESLKKAKMTPEEGERLEGSLKRKSSDTRRAVLALLLKLPAEAVQASGERLLTSKNANQRLAGLEMLRVQVEKNRRVEACRQRARQYQSEHPRLTDEETDQIDSILDTERGKYTLENGLGLLDPAQRTLAIEPKGRKVRFFTEAAVEILKSLDALIHQYRAHSYTVQWGQNTQSVLLGDHGFPNFDSDKPLEEEVKKLPLLDVWQAWHANRTKKLRDADGLELLRASMLLNCTGYEWDEWKSLLKKQAFRPLVSTMLGGIEKPPRLKYESQVGELIEWLLRLYPVGGEAIDWLLDAAETAYALIPEAERRRVPKPNNSSSDWRNLNPFQIWLNSTSDVRADWTDAQKLRRWQLLHWRDQPAVGFPRSRPELEVLLDGYRLGAASEADVVDDLLGPRDDTGYWGSRFNSLASLTARTPHEIFTQKPELKTLVDRCRERILELELKRGDTETPATGPARFLYSLWGTDTLLRLLVRLGKRSFRKSYWGDGKIEVLTHLVEVTFPLPEDTPEAFADKVRPLIKGGQIPEERLLDLAFLSQQWLPHIKHYLGWEGFEEGLWWFFEHMNSSPDNLDEEEGVPAELPPGQVRLSRWEKIVRERTSLSEEDRQDGAVDVEWFRRVYPPLGKKRWEALAKAAKYGDSPGSAKKAFYLSQVLLGKAKKSDIVRDIRVRNLREGVRLLGLLPLASGSKREKDLINRYRVLQGYRRYAKALGPMSREDALRTAAIGLENLARTAGYPDPIRFEWAMEAKEIADLAQGPLSHTADGVTVTLSLNAQAQPEVLVKRGDKELKQIPPKVRKDRKISSIVDRKAELRRQASRVRESLERMMCRGDHFTGQELVSLFEHPLLVPLLSRLVLLGEGIAGYPESGGKVLRHFSGSHEPVKPDEKLRIAHPYDLLQGGDWHEWQHECFKAERVQPFKQVFRELYVLTEQERKDGDLSRRYAGQQVNPTQAQALFGSRGWGTDEGIEKTFHDAGLVASVDWRWGGGTPLDVEGWTFESVHFTKRGGWERIALKDVPPRIFSEVMRDLDLVVSVAHRGGVDPEASASTVEMRAALLKETCDLLKINNIRIQDNHVLIDGQLANYSLHLGSAVVHRQPGGHLCLVPVHSQHRGRIFLPFADDDPRTAEVISKVLMLARDHEIQDPNVLDQIRMTV